MPNQDMSKLIDLAGVGAIRDWVRENFLLKSDAEKMMASKIKITFGVDFEGKTYTITGGASETYTGIVPNTLIVEQIIKELNTSYTITCENTESVSYERTIEIGSYYGIYPLEFSPWLALAIVPWATGTDEEIAAMLDAAKAGTIDLQTDGGWAVGDVRTIQIGAFTGGGNVSHEAQSIDIVISSFADYNGCGSVMQFDFKDALATTNRMNATDTNVGGYGSSEMKTTTLPALVNALPIWLKDRLLEFPVLASAGNKLSIINTVTGNKLALRSEVEIFGTVSYAEAGEGFQIPYYTTAANRIKKKGQFGSAGRWWERSPRGNMMSTFCIVTGSGDANGHPASIAYGVAPFGCI